MQSLTHSNTSDLFRQIFTCPAPDRWNPWLLALYRKSEADIPRHAEEHHLLSLQKKLRDRESAAISGIDVALWDLLGHQLGLPVHELLLRSMVRDHESSVVGPTGTVSVVDNNEVDRWIALA